MHIGSPRTHTLSMSAVDEKKVRDMADALVDRGFVKAGYTYLNIDGEVLSIRMPLRAAATRPV